MTDAEKALIDAKREGYVACEEKRWNVGAPVRSALSAFARTDAPLFPRDHYTQRAAEEFPYPPKPKAWREAVTPNLINVRRKHGAWESRCDVYGWRPCVWLSDEFVINVAECLDQPEVEG